MFVKARLKPKILCLRPWQSCKSPSFSWLISKSCELRPNMPVKTWHKAIESKCKSIMTKHKCQNQKCVSQNQKQVSQDQKPEMEQHGNSVSLPLPLPEPLPATPLPLPDWQVALPGQSLPLSGYSMILLKVKWYKANLTTSESILNNSTLKTMLELW